MRLRVWLVIVGYEIDFPKLETIVFGNSTFITNENAIFRGGLVSVG